jgi:glycosyltransferase involved in cell wall biosynthesis
MQSRGPSILTAHSLPRLNEGNIAGAAYFNRLYPSIYGRFDHIITITKPSTREIAAMLPDKPVTLIPNGVDMEKFAPSAEKRRAFREFIHAGDDVPVVLTVAQQTPRKGIFEFLETAAELPEYRFVWVGGYPYGPLSSDRKTIEKAKAKAGSNVLFTGFVPDITSAYCGADLLFMPSRGEVMSIVVLEALSSGLPVVARDLPEFREVFSGISCFFSDSKEAAAVVSDEDCWRRSAGGARSSVAQFDIHAVAKQHIRLYTELIS